MSYNEMNKAERSLLHKNKKTAIAEILEAVSRMNEMEFVEI